MLLKAVEYGVSPTFLLMTRERDALQDTEYQKYYSLCWADWKDQIEAVIGELESLDGVLGQRITAHGKLGQGVYVTTFADGSVVYVNYGQTDAVLGDVTVPARGFVRKGDK